MGDTLVISSLMYNYKLGGVAGSGRLVLKFGGRWDW